MLSKSFTSSVFVRSTIMPLYLRSVGQYEKSLTETIFVFIIYSFNEMSITLYAQNFEIYFLQKSRLGH